MYALQNASAVTTNASELAKKAKAFIDREVFLIPNGIDTGCFKPMERNEGLAEALGLEAGKRKEERSGEWKVESGCPVIGFVGELREKKGLATLLSAYAQICKKGDVSLLIVGEVRDGEDKKLFDEFRVTNPQLPIIVTGQIPHKDLPAYYSLMDVFAHPSLRDGMPNAILEAMACGKTVIATPVGGVKDVIVDEVNGLLVNVNDAEGLAEKVAEALSQPEKRESIGRAARDAVLHRFTLEKELQANLKIYESLGVAK
jgi:glycosyltransferase involved in cell wall biosynthesis